MAEQSTITVPAFGAAGPGWRRLLVEPARPASVRSWSGAPWLVVATVCIGAFMGQLDASIVIVAVPDIQQDLHASLASVEWVVLSYLLVLVASLPAVGRIADMYGRKLLYTYGFIVFTAASLGCGLAPSLGWLIACRVIQALGAAMLQANSVALIRTNVAPGKLGRAIGLQGAAQATGLALGPTVGGLLIGLGGWRLIFYVNLPAGMIGILLAWLLLPRTRSRAPRVRLDWVGLVVLAPAVSALLWAFSRASGAGFGDPVVLVCLAVAAGLFVILIRVERRVASPVLDLTLFRSRSFATGISSGLLCYLVLFGVLFVSPLYLEAAHHLSPVRAGLVITLLPLVLAVTAPFAGYAADRLGARVPTVAGMLLVSGALALLAAGPATVSVLALALAVSGLGFGLFIPANNATVAGAGKTQHAGMISGMLNMSRGVGTSLGVAVTGAAYALAAGSGAGHLAPPAHAESGLRVAAIVLLALAAGGATIAARTDTTRPRSGQPRWAEL